MPQGSRESPTTTQPLEDLAVEIVGDAGMVVGLVHRRVPRPPFALTANELPGQGVEIPPPFTS